MHHSIHGSCENSVDKEYLVLQLHGLSTANFFFSNIEGQEEEQMKNLVVL